MGGSDVDIDFADYFPNGIVVNGFKLDASATTDVVILRHKTASGVMLIKLTGNETVSFAIPLRCHPYMDHTEQIISTPLDATLIINLA